MAFGHRMNKSLSQTQGWELNYHYRDCSTPVKRKFPNQFSRFQRLQADWKSAFKIRNCLGNDCNCQSIQLARHCQLEAGSHGLLGFDLRYFFWYNDTLL
jgi:hypothetical protein